MELKKLMVFRNLLDDEVFSQTNDEFEISSRLIEKAEKLGLYGNLVRSYLIYILAHEPNLVSTTLEMNGGKIGESLKRFFARDILFLMPLFSGEVGKISLLELRNYKPTNFSDNESFISLEQKLSGQTNAEKIAEIFIEHYRRFGYGDIAAYRAFCWDNEKKTIVGIRHFEKIILADLIGYAHQKELLTGNTEAFLEGKPANNVLLVGARGTGKSSGVKALVNEYYSRGLRLLQITKSQLKYLPEIMDALRKFASKRFIIFLDDISFEESESEYKYLKSAIEGGVASRPENVLIYATSNRRHLIRETWRDRAEHQDELYRDDSVNETISLSDRFGLIIHYYSPTQEEYLEIIKYMLGKQGIELDGEALRIEGLRWEMTHSGRNGRTAQQFVNYYLGQRQSS